MWINIAIWLLLLTNYLVVHPHTDIIGLFNRSQPDDWTLFPVLVHFISIPILLVVTSHALYRGSIVRERELGTLENLLLTPLSGAEIILGKAVATLPVVGAMVAPVLLGIIGILLLLRPSHPWVIIEPLCLLLCNIAFAVAMALYCSTCFTRVGSAMVAAIAAIGMMVLGAWFEVCEPLRIPILIYFLAFTAMEALETIHRIIESPVNLPSRTILVPIMVVIVTVILLWSHHRIVQYYPINTRLFIGAPIQCEIPIFRLALLSPQYWRREYTTAGEAPHLLYSFQRHSVRELGFPSTKAYLQFISAITTLLFYLIYLLCIRQCLVLAMRNVEGMRCGDVGVGTDTED